MRTSRYRPSTTSRVAGLAGLLADEIHATSLAARVGFATVGDRMAKETPRVPSAAVTAGLAAVCVVVTLNR